MALFGLSAGVLVVFAIILVALALFATELIPVDITAIGVMVTLLLVQPVTEQLTIWGVLEAPVYVLTEPGSDVSATAQGLSGFASTATITVLAMFILSAGVRRTGVIQILGSKVAAYTREDETRQLGATIGLVSPISGFINNTAAVAILLPMVADLAQKGKTSPSKLLMPLSFASMFGGTLTLIGTSTNILASEITGRLGRELGIVYLEEFSMFEFTSLGVLVMTVGIVYLMTVGRWLVPERIKVAEDLTDEFEMADYLTEVVVREDSPIVGQTVRSALQETDLDVDLVQLIRGDEVFLEPLGPKSIQPGDVFTVRTDRDTLVEVMDTDGLDLLPEVEVTEAELEAPESGHNLVEIVIAPGSSLVRETLASSNFRQRYDATVLALRRGDALLRERMDEAKLRVGDTLLIEATTDSIDRLNNNRNFIVAQEVDRPDYRQSKIPVAVGLVAAVVGLAAATPIDIATAALAGALGMVLTGCLKPTEIYDSVQWDVIFLLAGVIPLGIALEVTGGAELIADAIVAIAPSLPPIVVLGLMYVVTALLTNVISNNASVVLMVPVAVEVATQLGANAFAFVLAVTFAASTAFMTPIGYQTNLFVYGPGGYRFTDYIRLGGPLQAIFAVVTTLGIAFIWGLQPPV
ncbi:Di- and tricarboxylate transporter [Halapricum desulfuricans]|uniref:Di- and tricarboxylate transporter n=1 Tax=Halapricum desulfuricans TaxID=2841257 RepID=A0A897NYL4_9EURY|nr:SLC13 family permease [Halapricum desulfuricans]QSG15166.1 Di- and tricarboxylate transporter [Halapricum desulfuricans]